MKKYASSMVQDADITRGFVWLLVHIPERSSTSPMNKPKMQLFLGEPAYVMRAELFQLLAT